MRIFSCQLGRAHAEESERGWARTALVTCAPRSGRLVRLDGTVAAEDPRAGLRGGTVETGRHWVAAVGGRRGDGITSSSESSISSTSIGGVADFGCFRALGFLDTVAFWLLLPRLSVEVPFEDAWVWTLAFDLVCCVFFPASWDCDDAGFELGLSLAFAPCFDSQHF